MAVATVTGTQTLVATAISGLSSASFSTGTATATISANPPPPVTAEVAANNLRIVFNNAADRVSSLVASTTAGSLAASNLLTDFKTEVWRSTGTTATLTATWASAESLSMVALPFSNLSSTATIRVQLYTNAGDSVAVLDTGSVLACPAALGFTAPWATSGANTFAYGGGVYAAVWFALTSAKKAVITITDSSNPAGYIEAARLVTGKYWSPDRNVEWESPKMLVQDDSKHERSDAGALWTDRGPMYRKLSFDLGIMTDSDRNTMWAIIRGNGMTRSMYISLMPASTDSYGEQIYSIYGRLSQASALQMKFLNMSASSLNVDEI